LHRYFYLRALKFGKVEKARVKFKKGADRVEICRFLGAGLAWLFLFSLPIGHGKTLYQVGQHYIINTAPVQWLGSKISTGYEATLEATNENELTTTVRELPEKLSRR
jgi:hypothetical protein